MVRFWEMIGIVAFGAVVGVGCAGGPWGASSPRIVEAWITFNQGKYVFAGGTSPEICEHLRGDRPCEKVELRSAPPDGMEVWVGRVVWPHGGSMYAGGLSKELCDQVWKAVSQRMGRELQPKCHQVLLRIL